MHLMSGRHQTRRHIPLVDDMRFNMGGCDEMMTCVKLHSGVNSIFVSHLDEERTNTGMGNDTRLARCAVRGHEE